MLLDLPVSRDYFFPFFEDLGVRPKIAHREASLNMVCSMVANGLGYSILNATPKLKPHRTASRLSPAPLWKHYAPCVLAQFGRNGNLWAKRRPGFWTFAGKRLRSGCPISSNWPPSKKQDRGGLLLCMKNHEDHRRSSALLGH